MKKRSRTADEEAADALRHHPAVIEAIQTYASLSESQQKMLLQAYSSLAPQQRHLLWEHQEGGVFRILPEGIWRIIASSNVGVMMNLAIAFHVRPPAKNFLQDILRTEKFWMDKFAEDYPQDYKFCKGILPFFVLHELHPYYTPGCVPEEDKPGWKRYYLHTAQQYHAFAAEFTTRYQSVLGPVCSAMQIEFLDPKLATRTEIYRWVHRVILGLHFNEYDYQAPIAWVFVCVFVWFVSPSDTPSLNAKEIIARFWSYARRPRFEWLIPYLTHSKAYLLRKNEKIPTSYHDITASYFLSPLLVDDVDRVVSKFEKKMHRTENALQQPEYARFLKALPRPHDWRKAKLFSPEDREKISTLLSSTALDITIPFWPFIDPQQRKMRIGVTYRIWECLEACYTIPCISSAYFGSILDVPMAEFIPKSISMQIYSDEIQRITTNNVAKLPPHMPLRLPIKDLDDNRNTWPVEPLERKTLALCCPFNMIVQVSPEMFAGDDLEEQFVLDTHTCRRLIWLYSRSPRERMSGGKILFIASNLV